MEWWEQELGLHVSSRTTVRASTKVSRTPAGPEAEPVSAAGSKVRACRATVVLADGHGGVWSLGTAELQTPANSLNFSIGRHWVQIPALPPVPHNCVSPVLCPGPAGWRSGSLVAIRTLQWGPGVEASIANCEIGSVWGWEGWLG